MAINKIKVTLYQDSKRNTATCYLKFNNINEEIFLGFNLNTKSSHYDNQTAKTKLTKTLVTGISAKLIPLATEHRDFDLSVTIDGTNYLIHLAATDELPITHIGCWENTVSFTDWFSRQPDEVKPISIRDVLNQVNE